MAQKILVGDFWQDQYGNLIKRESVGWFEKITNRHAPHYRILKLYKIEDKYNINDRNIAEEVFLKKPSFPPNQLLSEGAFRMTTQEAQN